MIIGQPGIGKTVGVIAMVKAFNDYLAANNVKTKDGKDKRLGFRKIQFGQTTVGDFSGVPVVVNGEVRKLMPDDLPTVEKDGEYGVLFLDEISTADSQQVQPALGLADDSRSLSGIYTLPEHWLVVGAANGPDCPNFVSLDPMTLTRFTPYAAECTWREDYEDYARSFNKSNGNRTTIHPDIIAYLEWKPDELINVITKNDAVGSQFACPRSWKTLSDKIYSLEYDDELKKKNVAIPVVKIQGFTNTTEETKKKYSPYNKSFSDFVGNTLGVATGDSFTTFLTYKEGLIYDMEKIKQGKEKPMTMEDMNNIKLDDMQGATIDMQQGMTMIIAENLITYFIVGYETLMDLQKDPAKYEEESKRYCTEIGHATAWFLMSDYYDLKLLFITLLMAKMKEQLGFIFGSDDFNNIIEADFKAAKDKGATLPYENWIDFCGKEAELLSKNLEELQNMVDDNRARSK
jgi:hypothetical protein